MAENSVYDKVESEALFTLTLLAIFSVAALDAARPFLGTGASLETWASVKNRLYLRLIVIRLREKRQNHDQHNDEALGRSGVHAPLQ